MLEFRPRQCESGVYVFNHYTLWTQEPLDDGDFVTGCQVFLGFYLAKFNFENSISFRLPCISLWRLKCSFADTAFKLKHFFLRYWEVITAPKPSIAPRHLQGTFHIFWRCLQSIVASALALSCVTLCVLLRSQWPWNLPGIPGTVYLLLSHFPMKFSVTCSPWLFRQPIPAIASRRRCLPSLKSSWSCDGDLEGTQLVEPGKADLFNNQPLLTGCVM